MKQDLPELRDCGPGIESPLKVKSQLARAPEGGIAGHQAKLLEFLTEHSPGKQFAVKNGHGDGLFGNAFKDVNGHGRFLEIQIAAAVFG